ncbi:MAG: hypothetical protein P8Y63_04970 [Deltaproteobacteria bacterium]|jgi:hypothetical protein
MYLGALTFQLLCSFYAAGVGQVAAALPYAFKEHGECHRQPSFPVKYRKGTVFICLVMAENEAPIFVNFLASASEKGYQLARLR